MKTELQIDNYRHRGLRNQLVKQLMQKGITDGPVLTAISQIPRHFFIDQAFADWAYKDVPFHIDADQTISQPYTVAFMTSMLGIQKGDKVLEVGTGSGYQAAVLSHIGAKVYSIERQYELYTKTATLLSEIGYGDVRTFFGDGYIGLERFAEFDKIIITAGAPEIPHALLTQLRVGGMMIVPIDKGDDTQTMTLIVRTSPSKWSRSIHGTFKFVPMLPGMMK